MMSGKNYDDLLCPILHNEGDILGFLDKVFDFVYRRTDLFKLKTDDTSEKGLIPGEAEKIVKSVFCKYMQQSVLEQNNALEIESESVCPEYISEETVITSSVDDLAISSTTNSAENINTEGSSKNQIKDDDRLDLKVSLMDPDSYNGASFEDYSWAQTLKDADIRINVPNTVATGKNVRVLIQQNHLKAEILLSNEWVILKDEDLSWKINVEESTWTFVPREYIHVCLQKIQERWWDSFFISEPKIDLKSIDPSIAYEELDEDSQAKINELMYDQHMKRLGKPTIEQSKVHTILKEAWDCEGSPFKGQPFDPTLVDVQSSELRR